MKASTGKIIWHDWPALCASVTLPIIWAIHFIFPYIKRGPATPLWLPLMFTLAAVAALVWRIARVHRFFATGSTVEGTVKELRIARDRGRLEYSYRVGGQHFSAWCPVHKSKQVTALHVGQKLTVLVAPEKPDRSIVADLFVARGGKGHPQRGTSRPLRR